MATTDATLTNTANVVVFEGTITGDDLSGLPTGWTEDASDPANVDGGAGSLTFEDGTVTTAFTGDGLDSQDSGNSSRVLAQAGSGMFSAPPAGVPAFMADDAAGATVALDGGGLLLSHVVPDGTIAYASTAAAAPTTFTTPIYYDSTAVSGGLYAWDGSAYIQIGGLIA